jgi:dolichol-phosphate mannosyltransferase
MTAFQPPPTNSGEVRIPIIAVVIPCFKVSRQILGVISAIGPEVSLIFVVDDQCPEHTGDLVEEQVRDTRVHVVRLPINSGVGGAVMAGYKAAMAAGADVFVKIDGDGQMDPTLLPRFVQPIINGRADYTKGNRFFDIEKVRTMPTVRLIGNAGLSFFAKVSTGYWHMFDPNNGYTAIHARAASLLPLDKIDRRYFFESDMLFRLNTIHAVVVDIPMEAIYGDEVSNLDPVKEFGRFFKKHSVNFFKRIFYNYFLRDFSIASIELLAGLVSLAFGTVFGLEEWRKSLVHGVPATAGTVMVAAIPTLVGIQLLLNFLNFDMRRVSTTPIHLLISAMSPKDVGPAHGERTHGNNDEL